MHISSEPLSYYFGVQGTSLIQNCTPRGPFRGPSGFVLEERHAPLLAVRMHARCVAATTFNQTPALPCPQRQLACNEASTLWGYNPL